MIVGHVDTKAFINTMHQSQAEVEIVTPGDTLRDVEAMASADTLADSRESFRDTDRSESRITSRNTGSHARRDEGLDSCKNTERCSAAGIGRNASCRSSRRSDKDN